VLSDGARQFHDLLRSLKTSGPAPSLVESRLAMELIVAVATEPEGVTYEPLDADGVPAEWAVPTGAPGGRALLYLHGGGYTLGSISAYRRLVGHLAKAADLPVLSIDYRLAPEHPFPAGLDDAVTVFSWLLGQGYGPTSVGIGGDSAGGGLALATALALRERGLPAPVGLVLLSPWTDLCGTGESITTNAATDLVLSRDTPEDPDISGYAGGHDLTEPLISPLYADFSGFVPFIVHVGGAELLLDDSTRLAERAAAAGCDVTIEVWPEMQHVFQVAAGNVEEADASLAKLGAWLSRRISA
jgi:acetyl esterase/lipase